MGYTQKLGLLAQSVFQDSSLNVGIGAAPSGTYKLEVTGTAKVSGIGTFGSSAGAGLRVYGSSGTNQWDIYLNSTNLRFSDNTGTGSVVFDRPISGTSATFSGALTAGATTLNGNLDISSGYFINMAWTNDTRTIWERYNSATYFQRISSNVPSRQLRLESNGAYGNASIVLDGQGNTTTSTIITSDNSIFTGTVSLNTGNSLRLYRPDSSYPSSSWFWNIYMDSSNLLSFAVNGGTPKMVINASGNVGIGATSVNNEKLTINQTTGNSSALLVNTVGVTTGQSYGLTVQAGTNGSDRSFAVFNQAGTTEYFSVRGDGYLKSPTTYNNTTASPNYLSISTSGFFERYVASSQRYKEEIKDWDVNGLDIILALRPRTYKYKKEYYNKADVDFLGLIAEEVAEVNTYLADYENEDGTGQVENVRYATIVVPLIKAIQEQQAIITSLQEQINELKNK
jgi:hypothetical protein